MQSRGKQMQVFNDVEQGSPEWFSLRCGCITASEFKTVMAKGRGNAPSKTRRTYMLKLAGEIITGEVQEGYTNAHMERGKIMEDEARSLYELVTEAEVKQVGFIKDEHGFGYSPDGLIDGVGGGMENGLLEIKTKLPHLQIALLLADEVPSEHMHQLQGGLWVSGRYWIDFVSYWPGLPLFIKRVYRDKEFFKKLEKALEDFRTELNGIVKKIEGM